MKPTDSILAMLLAEAGCPYPEGSAEAVIWLQGRVSGIKEARREFERERYGANVVQVENPPRRRPYA